MHFLHSGNSEPDIVRPQHFTILDTRSGHAVSAGHMQASERTDDVTFIDEIRGFENSLVRSMRMSLEQARLWYRKRREFSRTYSELSKLSDHELLDLGIARCDIAKIARAAVSGD